MRVVCEQLLNTMDIEQRRKLMAAFPGLYQMIYPGSGIVVLDCYGNRLG
jgi:hypothetical protein